MRIEQRVDGAQIMRPGTGRQRLLVASTHQAELIIVCELGDVVSVRRHYDVALAQTVPCECRGPCYTQRLDRFVASLYRAGPTIWDERVLILPAQAWFSLQSSCLARGLAADQIRGLRCMLRRVGSKQTGRTSCEVQDRVKSCPGGFDLAAGVRNATGIAADFFGDSDGGVFPQMETPPPRGPDPARGTARERVKSALGESADLVDKPRQPLGKRP